MGLRRTFADMFAARHRPSFHGGNITRSDDLSQFFDEDDAYGGTREPLTAEVPLDGQVMSALESVDANLAADGPLMTEPNLTDDANGDKGNPTDEAMKIDEERSPADVGCQPVAYAEVSEAKSDELYLNSAVAMGPVFDKLQDHGDISNRVACAASNNAGFVSGEKTRAEAADSVVSDSNEAIPHLLPKCGGGGSK